MWGISILADFKTYISFHTVVVFALGKNLLFKFALGHCGLIQLTYHTFVLLIIVEKVLVAPLKGIEYSVIE